MTHIDATSTDSIATNPFTSTYTTSFYTYTMFNDHYTYTINNNPYNLPNVLYSPPIERKGESSRCE